MLSVSQNGLLFIIGGSAEYFFKFFFFGLRPLLQLLFHRPRLVENEHHTILT